jgi:hypothetical protein
VASLAEAKDGAQGRLLLRIGLDTPGHVEPSPVTRLVADTSALRSHVSHGRVGALPMARRSHCDTEATRLKKGLGDGVQAGRGPWGAPPRLPANGGAQHGQRRRS